MIALLNPNPRKYVTTESFDIDAFYGLIERFKLEFTLATITELPTYRESIRLYNPDQNAKQIQEWIKTIVK